MTRNDGDPLVARWEYGSGRAVYLNMHHITSDCDLAIDQDCDGADVTDVDGDGVEGGEQGEDCDDEDAAIYPDAAEVCDDGVDNDCDGDTDADDGDCADPVGDDDTTDEPPDDFTGGCACRSVDRAGQPIGLALLVAGIVLAGVRRCRR
ncbi:MAG: putative metal-binding motif-containing protein [Myxococcota bacterium]|nr:putative metal-binding motif-containing protein [Myxococcota bacterium]